MVINTITNTNNGEAFGAFLLGKARRMAVFELEKFLINQSFLLFLFATELCIPPEKPAADAINIDNSHTPHWLFIFNTSSKIIPQNPPTQAAGQLNSNSSILIPVNFPQKK